MGGNRQRLVFLVPTRGLIGYQGDLLTDTRENDLVVNVIIGKKLTNVRAAGKDENLTLIPPMRMSLEKAMSYIQDDELVEITPLSVRLRKRYLDANERKRMERKSAAAE